jgi:hypothetical protein
VCCVRFLLYSNEFDAVVMWLALVVLQEKRWGDVASSAEFLPLLGCSELSQSDRRPSLK